jgi:hypothetical protein
MKTNMRSRNIAINSYVGMLAVTVVAGFATLFLVHLILEVPLSVFASSDVYSIDTSL